MKKTVIKVNGMVCNGCENRVQNALKTIDGIEEVVANHPSLPLSNKINFKICK